MSTKLCVLLFYVLLPKNEVCAKISIWDLILPKQYKFETKKEPGHFGLYYNYEFPSPNIDPRTQNYFYRRDADKEKIAEAFEKNAHYITDQQFTILKNLNVIPEKEADVIHDAVNEIRFKDSTKEKVQSEKGTEKENGEENVSEQSKEHNKESNVEVTTREASDEEDLTENNEKEDTKQDETTETTHRVVDVTDTQEKHKKENDNNKTIEENVEDNENGTNQTMPKKTVVKQIKNIKITAILYRAENNAEKEEQKNTEEDTKEDSQENNKSEDTEEDHEKEEVEEEHNSKENEQDYLNSEEDDVTKNQTASQQQSTKNITIIAELYPAQNK